MDKNLNIGGASDTVTVSTALLNQRLVTLNAPRTLTPSEIELLRKSKQEIAERYKKELEKELGHPTLLAAT